MNPILTANATATKPSYWLGGFVWLMGWLAIYFLDPHLDSSNLAMLLVLTSAVAAVCLPWRISVFLAISFVLAFDWFFISPRGTFTVDFQQHTVMLLVMMVVNIIVVSLMAVRRAQSELAERHAIEADRLRQWSDALLESATPYEHIGDAQSLLAQLSARNVVVLVLKNQLPAQDDMEAVWLMGEAGIEQRHALWHCTRNNQQLGRNTGRYELFSDVYLPLRARGHALGAVLICNFAEHEFATRVHLQAICDQFGNALERYRLQQQEINAREQARSQLIRNNLLAAISHDYRTPLATIMGAASSLNEQAEKLDIDQQRQLTQRIINETERLNSITHNILQLARLDADKRISCDWQSAEEIVGDLLKSWRERNLDSRLQIKLQPNLPLVWCDSVLIKQLLENLTDNAFKYSPSDSVVKVQINIAEKFFLFSITDAGQGIAENLRDKIFEPFQRGSIGHSQVKGAGVGLALCRAIALAHNGELRLECPPAGGTCFILRLPLRDLPADHNLQTHEALK